MFDNTETDSLELLRFYPSLTAIDGFEDALHERVRQVGRIPDHAFPLIVAVERLEGDGALALVSTHTPGKRLSAFFDKPGPRRGLNAAFVTGIVTQVVQALAMLQSKGDNLTHSAITPDRIVVTPGGRICVVEHVLGLALRRLNLSASQLWREFGLVSAPTPTGAIKLDARTDVFQLGVLTLEMLLGRRLTPLDLKDRLPDLLDQWSDAATRAGMASDRLRVWIERALQLSDPAYGTAADAYADLRDLPSESPASAFDSLPTGDDALVRRSLQPAKQAAGQDSPMANAPAPDDVPISTPPPTRPALMPTEPLWTDFAPEVKPVPAVPRLREPVPVEPTPAPRLPPAPSLPAVAKAVVPAVAKAAAPAVPKAAALAAAAAKTAAPRRTLFKTPRVSPWIAAALGLVVLVEGGVIAALLMRQPATAVAAGAGGNGSSIPADGGGGETRGSATPVLPAALVVETQAPPPPRPGADPIAAAAGNQRSGGVKLVTPIELKVLQGDKVLGSTADGPIIAPAGTHQLDLSNAALGFRTRMSVTFRSGAITSVNVTVPSGKVSLNAQPWGEAFIDGRSVGETPLANLSVPLGEHEVVFRHPSLGERRQTITVRADAPARVSATFDK
jgi:hypothetical protein